MTQINTVILSKYVCERVCVHAEKVCVNVRASVQ